MVFILKRILYRGVNMAIMKGSCEKCRAENKQVNKLYGKKLCLKCSMEFFIAVKKHIEGNPNVKKEFKRWFFEMEIEE